MRKEQEKILMKELKKSFFFFMKEANWNKASIGYGLIKDKDKYADEIASIASCGYGLAALIIGVEHKWISFQEGYEKAEGMLSTFLNVVEEKNGFYYHFVNIETGKREWNCEISIIDTAIFICGALTAGEYFKGIVKKKAQELYKRVNWNWYSNPEESYFYMGYTPERGFEGKWDMYAEQLMLYILGIASDCYPIQKEYYEKFQKPIANYDGIFSIVHSYCGSLFTYQYSHAWIDFRGKADLNGLDWFENSIKATKANRKYCINHTKQYETYGKDSWGLTACITPDGYKGAIGAKPCLSDLEIENDGTISPCGAIGSIVFTPKESIQALEYYRAIPKLWGKYGLKDSFQKKNGKLWTSKEYIGIDKGIGMIMIENYLSNTIWLYCMKNKYIKRGMKLLQISNERVKALS